MTFRRNSYCSYCGQAFAEEQPWPRTCTHCTNISFLNPLPIVVMLAPVDEGLLVIRRGIPPQQGHLALPGGFVDWGESWQEAGAREVWEEAGVVIEPLEIKEFAVRSTPRGNQILIFGLAPAMVGRTLPPFEVTTETTERQVITGPVELAFPLHTEAVTAYFEDKIRKVA
jgi:ADP-ribose pyrophosphatase YjhB (NUDIX family)